MLQQVSNASTVLTWVRPDLDKHLEQIRTQIDHIANSQHIGDGVKNTSGHLRQLRYTFEALMLQGATLVFEEMIRVCDELERFNIHDRQTAYAALMEAIVVVPSYLDRLQAGHHDLPVLLLPVINKLRAAYKANVVSEATLFAPNLDVPLPELESELEEGKQTETEESVKEFVQRSRRQYENTLLAWLQNQDDTDLLSPLHSICETMRRRSGRLDLKRMWWIAAEVIGGLIDGVIDNDVHIHRLFARLNLILKNLSEDGEAAVNNTSVDAISHALLFHVAQSKSGSEGVDHLRERFQLKALVPDREALLRARGAVTGRNRDLYNSLGAAVRDELAMIKDALDLELRTGTVEPTRREQSREALLRLKDTLNMMGLGDSARSIEKLAPAFEVSGNKDEGDAPPREALLLDLAEKLIQVESVLEEQIETLGEPLETVPEKKFIDLPLHELQRIRVRTLDEAVLSLHQVQQCVHQHFSGDEDADFLSPMAHIAGAMEMLGDGESAALALQLRNALGNVLWPAHSEAAVDKDQLLLVTDAVAAFELYLAGCRDQQSNSRQFLEILKDRLGELPVGEMVLSLRKVPTPPEKPEAEPARTPEPAVTEAEAPQAIDPDLLAVFLEEFDGVAAMLKTRTPQWLEQVENTALLTEIRRGFHTLKGSGRMVGAVEVGEFSWHVEDMLNALLSDRDRPPRDTATITRLAVAALPELKLRLLQQPTDLDNAAVAALSEQAERVTSGAPADWQGLADSLPADLRVLLPETGRGAPEGPAEPPAADEELSIEELACSELAENLAVMKGLVDTISRERNLSADEEQLRAIHTIAGTMALQPLGREADVARAIEGLLEAQQNSRKAFGDSAIWAIASGLAHLQACLARRQGDEEPELSDNEDRLIEELLALGVAFEAPAPEKAPEAGAADAEPAETGAAESAEPEAAESENGAEAEAETGTEAADAETADAAPEETETAEEVQEDPVDTEILSIFLDEANEVLGRCDTLLNTWRDDLPNLEIVKNLQREIHTFKGGARMSGVSAMGDLSHAMESLLERIAGRNLPPSVSAVEALEQGCDRLNTWVDEAGKGVIPRAGQALKLFEQQVAALIAVPVQPVRRAAAPEPAAEEAVEWQEIPDVAPAPPEPERQVEASGGEEAGATQQIRVNADLMDSLVNSAGEISIFRSRLEQQVAVLRENLKESDVTIVRLREQFRKLEFEIEAQIRSRYQQEMPEGSEEFDPLELDRFSSIQQLSRGLSETVSDLLNLQEALDAAARKSEALLVKQSRVSTDLQEGLMQTRMVHFGTIAPRLRRIVRTAAAETRKKARLQLRMSSGGDLLDRNVLERITAPLEHLLRNAIVHGIEAPRVRSKLGKPKEGEIAITVAAEATEFVIRVEDDGAGLDLEAIRKRAIKTGLLDASADVQPQQLMHFILHSGFTTSEKVTGLAGRGVGMDVVNSEIKQIGGSTEIDSKTGEGCCFTIRIPFTLAVMQAIGVMAGEHRYLIPLSSVAGVARILPADYQQLLAGDSPRYSFAGEEFTVLELEPLLGEPTTPLGEDTISLLLIKSGEQRAAFRVPQLLGHHEIVIKPVGPQISSVPGILGGTISGEGQVIIIIDAGPLIRHALLTGARPAPQMENIDIRPKKPLAMVVDDSITMRKVTSRVLESHGFEVITARDGVDATEQMQDLTPDLLLLDIEMPRMDGYAVAEYVRADSRLRHIPIIMITSRAGEKHRERGRKAGANAYLSKPYKESDLIEEVNQLLGRKEMEDG